MTFKFILNDNRIINIDKISKILRSILRSITIKIQNLNLINNQYKQYKNYLQIFYLFVVVSFSSYVSFIIDIRLEYVDTKSDYHLTKLETRSLNAQIMLLRK